MCLQIEIKRFLESVYGLKVEKVHTVSYEGKRKRRKQGFFREIDYKKVSSYSAAHMHSTTCACDDRKASIATIIMKLASPAGIMPALRD